MAALIQARPRAARSLPPNHRLFFTHGDMPALFTRGFCGKHSRLAELRYLRRRRIEITCSTGYAEMRLSMMLAETGARPSWTPRRCTRVDRGVAGSTGACGAPAIVASTD
jgi:hypothetical protein